MAVDCHHLSVMTRGDRVETQPPSPLKEEVELNDAVALQTGVRSEPLGVVRHKRCDDRCLKLLRVIKDVMINTNGVGDSPGVVDVRYRTAARIRRTAPEFESDTHDLVARFDEHGGGDRRVHPT